MGRERSGNKARIDQHGFSGTKEYALWVNMNQRCYDKKHPAYKDYGGRGITVFSLWKEDFKVFITWALNNRYKEGLELDRVDNNDNYYPNNCRFVTKKENLKNRRIYHNAILITIQDKTKCLYEWYNLAGLPVGSMIYDYNVKGEEFTISRIKSGLGKGK